MQFLSGTQIYTKTSTSILPTCILHEFIVVYQNLNINIDEFWAVLVNKYISLVQSPTVYECTKYLVYEKVIIE